MSIDNIITDLRAAIAAGPSKGPWKLVWHTGNIDGSHDASDDWTIESADGDAIAIEGRAPSVADPPHIAACSPDRITALLGEIERLRKMVPSEVRCGCTLAKRLLGEGCDECNPAGAFEYLRENLAEAEAEIERLREREYEAQRDAIEMAARKIERMCEWTGGHGMPSAPNYGVLCAAIRALYPPKAINAATQEAAR